MTTPRFVVISLGNPEPYLNCLHSAGHVVLTSIQSLLSQEMQQPPWSRERFTNKPCRASLGPTWKLLQNPNYMNVSGPWVNDIYRKMLQWHNASASEMGLVLVHDDLEEGLGVVKRRKWDASHRGHNGVKSVNASLKRKDFPGARWERISVGIGRPMARDQTAVSDYVLRKMNAYQSALLNDTAAQRVLACMTQLEEGCGSE